MRMPPEMNSTLTPKISANSTARISAVSAPHVISIRVQFLVIIPRLYGRSNRHALHLYHCAPGEPLYFNNGPRRLVAGKISFIYLVESRELGNIGYKDIHRNNFFETGPR